jgi:formate dehydrogenase subunit gamma
MTRRKKIALGTLAAIVSLAFILPLANYGAHVLVGKVAAAQESFDGGDNPRSTVWREARGGAENYSAVGGREAGVLIQSEGQNWRRIRNGVIANIGAWFLLAVVAALVLFYAVKGRIKVAGEKSGRKILRWSVRERAVHGFTALSFIILAVTGLSLLFGRAVLIPLLGKGGFAAWAAFAKDAHNYVGPVFCVGIVLIIAQWIGDNIPTAADWRWLKRAGGMFGGAHPDAGRMNGGEKVWFWLIATAGVAVCVSGLIMDFPNFAQTRATMQTANLIHAALSIVWIGVALGHIYLGTVGTEGTLEGMTTGYVSEEWARQHHNLWLEEARQQEKSAEEQQPPQSAEARGPA